MNKPNHSLSSPTLADLSKKHGVSRQSLRDWRDKEGVDLSNESALAARVATSRNRGSSADITAARLKKLEAETRRIEHAFAVESGKFVCAASVKSEGHLIGQAFRLAIDQSATQLPPMLAGHDAGEILKILRREFRRTLQSLSDHPTSIAIKEP